MEPKISYEDDDLAVEFDDSPNEQVATELVTGSAGSGKTFEINRRLAADPSYALLCATEANGTG